MDGAALLGGPNTYGSALALAAVFVILGDSVKICVRVMALMRDKLCTNPRLEVSRQYAAEIFVYNDAGSLNIPHVRFENRV